MHKRILAAFALGWACLAGQAIAQTSGTAEFAAAQESCNSGNAEACRTAASAVLRSDARLARSLLERGCAASDRKSCDGLGLMLVNEGDYAHAAPLLAASCDNDIGVACGRLSNILLLGEGVAADRPQALARAERGCALDDAFSCAHLGVYLSAGDLFPRDLNRAAPALLKACAASIRDACSVLEEAATQAVQGADPHFEPGGALKLFEAACSGGQPKSCGAYGSFLAEGLFGPSDHARAATAFEAGCKLDHAMSCASLAEAYRNGRGVSRDNAQARSFAEKAIAIEPGNTDAQRTLKRLK